MRFDGKQVDLVPGSGWPLRFLPSRGSDEALRNPRFALGEVDEGLNERLAEALQRITRVRHLLGMARDTQVGGRAARSSVDVALELLRYEDGADAAGKTVEHKGPGRRLYSGDQIAFRLQNPTRHTVDVTLLFIDSGYGVTALFPEPGTIDDNRLGPGQTVVLPRVEVTADTVGAEQIVAIAVKAGRERQDFSCLEQPTLALARDAGGGFSSPLGMLLKSALYGEGGTRGLARSEFDHHAVRLLPWVTETTRRPKPEAKPDTAPQPEQASVADSFTGGHSVVLTPLGVWSLVECTPPRDWEPAPNPEKHRDGRKLYGRVAPAVVAIRTSHGHGTGFFLSADGWIITNHHVIAQGMTHSVKASEVAVHYGRLDDDGIMEMVGKPVTAQLYKADKNRDLALLKVKPQEIPPNGFPFLQLAEKPPVPGLPCAIVGHPSSGMLWTLRTGEVASIGSAPRDMIDVIMPLLAASDIERAQVEAMLARAPARKIVLSTCGVNPGDSGGPVVDKMGRLIAVTYAIPSSARDDKFSYHVHLHELNGLLAERPEAPMFLVPDAWDQPPRGMLADLDQDRKPDVLLLGGQGPSIALFDLDADSPDADMQALVGERKWDFECAVQRTGVGETAWYDTDNDGGVDLVLVRSYRQGDEDPKLVPAVRFLRNEAGWRRGAHFLGDILTPTLFQSKKIGERLVKLQEPDEEEETMEAPTGILGLFR